LLRNFQKTKSFGQLGANESYPYTSLDRPLGLQEFETPGISRQSAHEGGKAVSPTHQLSLPLRKYS